MIPAEYVPYLTLASAAASAAMAASLWCMHAIGERRRDRRVRGAIAYHVSEIVDMLEEIWHAAERADRGEREALVANACFARRVRRLEAASLGIDGLLAMLNPADRHVAGVRKILRIESWLVDRYGDPTVPGDVRHRLWQSGGADLERNVRDAVDTATSLGIVAPVTIK